MFTKWPLGVWIWTFDFDICKLDLTSIFTDGGKKSIYTYMLTNVLQGSGKQFWGSPPECLFLPLNAKHVEFSSLLFTEGLAVSDLC